MASKAAGEATGQIPAGGKLPRRPGPDDGPGHRAWEKIPVAKNFFPQGPKSGARDAPGRKIFSYNEKESYGEARTVRNFSTFTPHGARGGPGRARASVRISYVRNPYRRLFRRGHPSIEFHSSMKAAGRASCGASPAPNWVPKAAVKFSGRSPFVPPSRALTRKGFLRVIASRQFEAIENGSQVERSTGRFVGFVRFA